MMRLGATNHVLAKVHLVDTPRTHEKPRGDGAGEGLVVVECYRVAILWVLLGRLTAGVGRLHDYRVIGRGYTSL